ncbi:TetR/AcrR family transcriptional regulator [Mycolicibacterium komossense]|uniref:TetR/AcrR family transcriptional regulator n=1 Tax=Mycolicibacterium komossense TaxID=1779 RepID=A0ABT3CKT0_9MYCO|nr:TetR/AcrR family transcriptional regulator [Mycolicibacterium komossense]MCV7230017.1 TetR/AcrR family transcriptional regulator [Mycolicibacterium komossense]
MTRAVLSRGSARERVLEAAIGLFAEFGVDGTSLQMIANRLGVKKASVYYQFHSKEDIIDAVIRPVIEDIARLVTIAEAIPSVEARRDVTVSGMVELAVRNRRLSAVFCGDRAVEAHLRSDSAFVENADKMDALMNGPNPDLTTRVATSFLASGLFWTAADPKYSEVPDTELRRALLDTAQGFLRHFP